ncbi:Vitamin K epoxide reductase family protein [Rubripirellula lacrimiformis]|uniref:Vitamin K epoxide reductase family protein n=1 Tax=Rubripirellula lacrimiformis TaxID=1930273 RepID=A0A517NIU9_9BACT|nr:vitamin K epoxide reductase family protein [Rubripirellula lacrimiformis]QDT07054.1 Vitamin K epoxide reductase family protein [Rubripirellula lacrimiformis]
MIDLDAHVPPYKHNPSAWSQRIPICLLAFVAAAISTHLSMYQWGLIEATWDPVFGQGSNRVLKSDTAKTMYGILGIHDAALGVIAYLGDAILGFAGSTRRWQYRPWLVILFGIDVIPLGIVSVVLVLCQAFIVGDWCFLCLITASISLILVYWAWDEVRASLAYLRLVWTQNRDKGLLWRAFWGYHDEAIERAAETLLAREVD